MHAEDLSLSQRACARCDVLPKGLRTSSSSGVLQTPKPDWNQPPSRLARTICAKVDEKQPTIWVHEVAVGLAWLGGAGVAMHVDCAWIFVDLERLKAADR